MKNRMGPPEPGPIVKVTRKDFCVAIRVQSDLDREIVGLAMEMGERRRFSKTII